MKCSHVFKMRNPTINEQEQGAVNVIECLKCDILVMTSDKLSEGDLDWVREVVRKLSLTKGK